jgi:tetratricopeptide (TPR) repeat protein
LLRLAAEDALALVLAPPRRVTGVTGTGLAAVQGVGAVAAGRVSLTGRLTADAAEVRVTYSDGTRSEPVVLRRSESPEGRLLATAWGAGRVARLAPQAERHEEELLDLGRRFGLVSPASSLLVLESLDQYLRHDVEPPAMLAAMRRQWREARARAGKDQRDTQGAKLEAVVAMWQARVAWWERKPDVLTSAPRKDVEAAPVADPRPAAAPASPRPAAFDSVAATKSPMVMKGVFASRGRALGGAAADRDAVSEGEPGREAEASIQVKAWNPDTPYLKRLQAAAPGEREKVYAEQRARFAASPAFYLDCADFLLRAGDTASGVRVLTNLAELRIEDAALLRVLAWRLQQAGELGRAVAVLRRVARLRSEDPQSWRDLALALAERGKRAHAAADLEEAMKLFEKVILGRWNRAAEIEVLALEELNALIAWIGRGPGSVRPAVPPLDPRLLKNLDTDVRIVLAWDADATDVDLHVVEPGGEEAFYGHNRTAAGGLVSRDITDGYGPEEYLVRRTLKGAYAVRAKYFGSRQQTVIGPATLTATIFTDWGRATEKRQTLTLRLDRPHDIVEIGRVDLGGEGEGKAATAVLTGRGGEVSGFECLTVGMTAQGVSAVVGLPAEKLASLRSEVWVFRGEGRTWKLTFDKATGGLVRVAEALPGNAELIVVQ